MCLQEFYTLRADPDKSKSAKASAWDAMLQNAAPPYGATCMDFHKVWQPACTVQKYSNCLAKVTDTCLACPVLPLSRRTH